MKMATGTRNEQQVTDSPEVLQLPTGNANCPGDVIFTSGSFQLPALSSVVQTQTVPVDGVNSFAATLFHSPFRFR